MTLKEKKKEIKKERERERERERGDLNLIFYVRFFLFFM